MISGSPEEGKTVGAFPLPIIFFFGAAFETSKNEKLLNVVIRRIQLLRLDEQLILFRDDESSPSSRPPSGCTEWGIIIGFIIGNGETGTDIRKYRVTPQEGIH